MYTVPASPLPSLLCGLVFLSERGPHGCDSISLRLFPGKVAKIFRRGGFAHPPVPSLLSPFNADAGKHFFPTVTLWRTLIKKRAARGHLLLSECLSNPGEKMFPPNWPSPSPSMQQRRLALVTSMPFRELRSRVRGRPSISTVKCSALPIHHGAVTSGLTCNKGTTQRYRASERRVAGSTPRCSPLATKRTSFDGKSRQWRC